VPASPALAAAGARLLGLCLLTAGAIAAEGIARLVPAEKGFSPGWLQSLVERGTRVPYRGGELETIGMPVGGICAGQLYLGGDGRLWHWDIFNRQVQTGAEHYASPLRPASPLDQGFALLVAAGGKTQVRPLDRTGWAEIDFVGEYPLGRVSYRDGACPLVVELEAFSPFVPLDVDASSLPATVMRFALRNTSPAPATAELAGWLENAVCLDSAQARNVVRRNRIVRQESLVFLECAAEDAPEDAGAPPRPDLAFDDFEKEVYDGWQATGTAFGTGPVEKGKVPGYQGDLQMQGQRAVNSHASAPGGDVGGRDAATGTLTSRPFVIERNTIGFLVGGGAHKGRTCVDLLVDDRVVLSATGANDNRMQAMSWDVRRWQGKTARLQVVDNEPGSWGNIGIDDIVFSDRPRRAAGPLTAEADFGTMGLALLEPRPDDRACAQLAAATVPSGVFTAAPGPVDGPVREPFGSRTLGSLTRRVELAPGASATVTFVVVWHFPNLVIDGRFAMTGRHYATRFDSALAVAAHLASHFAALDQQTRLWHDTWYDSSLPYWFLDRTFLNTSTLATATCQRFANGRFYGWEGVGCCAGTCGHVWQYAHAVARIFPSLERDTRERVDLGLALQADGAVHFRGEFSNSPAVDGQAGVILRALREHQMCPDAAWLARTWPAIRRATQWLLAKDANGDGIIESNQHNTLDTDWFGPVAWLSGEYLAALCAAEQMARDVGDAEFAGQCRTVADRGREAIVAQLFNGEYFANRPDPQRPDTINSGTGCHIDQVLGQSWAFQVGLGRVLPARETVSALRSLWRYNVAPDVGPYRGAYKPGRWYAMPGEGGLIMCTFPRADWDYDKAKGKGAEWAAGYFNECMNGFEYQVAGHMIWEGLVREGLAVTRLVHDRYHASRRNPWNEVECGDHYARSMASYGVFLAACGFEYHGPRRHIAFAPRLTPEAFRAAFTSAEGWGSYAQKTEGARLRAALDVRWGTLRLRTVGLLPPQGSQPRTVAVTAAGKPVAASLSSGPDGRVLVALAAEAVIAAGERLEVVLSP